MGKGNRSTGMMNLERIFQSHFRKEAGASLEGVALGYVSGVVTLQSLLLFVSGAVVVH